MMIEKIEKNKKLLLGAYTNPNFVIKFRKYCKQNDFKQRTLFHNVVKFWMALDYITQEHIYRGRVDEACKEIHQQLVAQHADKIVSGAEDDAAMQKQKKDRDHRAKSL